MSGRWQFWIDRGGTFTDVVARRPDGALVTHKLLSEPVRGDGEGGGGYTDPAIAAIRHLLGVAPAEPIPGGEIEAVRLGTTVATNALLERKGEPTVLVITRGFRDALRIAYQNRPRLFDRRIVLPELLYSRVVEAGERVAATGEVLVPLDEEDTGRSLLEAYRDGFRAVAVVCLHGYRFPGHEQRIGQIARRIGFTQVSLSHETSPLMKLVSRGDTTVADAYLSPILSRYVNQVTGELSGVRLQFMQSSGGLTDARTFRGKDSILSAGRRHRGHGPDVGRGRVRQGHRLRHGRHLHRRLALRRRIRAAVRDPGGRVPHARSHAQHPHGRRGRRVAAVLRRRAVPGRPRLRGGEPGAGRVPPRRPADGHRRQPHARPDPARLLSARVRSRRRPAARRRRGAGALRRAGRRDRRRAQPRGGGGRLPGDRGGEHGERDQENLRAARLRRHRVRAGDLRRGGRPACLCGRRRPGHDEHPDPPARRGALGLRHGPGRRHRDAGGGHGGAAERRRRPRPAGRA